MDPLRKKTRVLAVVLIILLFVFYRSSHVPQAAAPAENVSKKELLKRELGRNTDYKTLGLNFQSHQIPRLPLLSTLREQLSFRFPYEPDKGFQKNIWQTWKVGLEEAEFPSHYRRYQESWANEPGYKHHVVTDEQCDVMVNQLYSGVPQVAEAWNCMPKSILKADFFRYLILFARGGVYSDIDTMGLKPIATWLSANETVYGKPNTAGLVVGIEADPDRPDWNEWYARRIQFCQWTIQAKKGHPMLRELVAKITEITLARKRKGQLQKILGKDEGGDIMDWTGPGIFTDMVFEYMNNVMQSPENIYNRTPEEIVTWELFTRLRVPMVLEDVMVLPITSFSPNVGQMGAGTSSHPLAYAQHMFSGSWKHDEKE